MSAGGGAASGAAGGAMGGPGMMAVGAGVGALGSIVGGALQANALSQTSAAALAQQQADRQQALGFTAPTASEMQNLQQQLAVTNQQVQQGQSLLNSYSPAAQAAGQQALALMNGQQAPALSVLQNQRSQQRAQLQQQLQQQLGPGYAESSAGIQALNNFDQQTANTMNTAQQAAVNQYMGYSQNAGQLGVGLQQQGSQGYLQNTATQQNQQTMQANAINGNPINGALSGAGQLAGAQAVGNAFGNIGAGIGSYGLATTLGGLMGNNQNSGGQASAPASSSAPLGQDYSNFGDMTPKYATGGKVKGKAMYKGNHPANDTVAAMLSPGEIVIPRTHATSVKKATEFVRKEIKKSKSAKPQKFKDHFQDGGMAAPQDYNPAVQQGARQNLQSVFSPTGQQASPVVAGQNLQFNPAQQFQRMKIRASIGPLTPQEAQTYNRYKPDGEPDLLPPGHPQNYSSDGYIIKPSRSK